MQVLTVAGQKGGVGKTTLAAHLAVAAEADGVGLAALLDIDPQRSLARWWQDRKRDSPAFAEVDAGTLAAALADLARRGYALVVIDTPGRLSNVIAAAIGLADLTLIPCRPGRIDLDAIAGTMDLSIRAAVPYAFVVNGATTGREARITGATRLALSAEGPTSPVVVRSRVDFPTAMGEGDTVLELAPESNSADEIRALWGFVAMRLARSPRRDRWSA